MQRLFLQRNTSLPLQKVSGPENKNKNGQAHPGEQNWEIEYMPNLGPTYSFSHHFYPYTQ